MDYLRILPKEINEELLHYRFDKYVQVEIMMEYGNVDKIEVTVNISDESGDSFKFTFPVIRVVEKLKLDRLLENIRRFMRGELMAARSPYINLITPYFTRLYFDFKYSQFIVENYSEDELKSSILF